LPVKFSCVFDVPYQKGIFDPYIKDAETFLRKQKHVPSLLENLPRYFEMVIASYDDIVSGKHETTYRIFDETGVTKQLSIADDIIAHYPMFWRSGLFISEDVYAILKPCIDGDYFHVSEVR
jgi:hypothetical protein